MEIEVIEVLKINANPWDLTDQDKIVATIKVGGEEKKLVLPFQKIDSNSEFMVFLTKVVQKIASQIDTPRVINLSKKWQGKYEVKNAS